MDIEHWRTIPTDAINKTTFPFTLSTFNPFNFNQRTPMKRLALLLPLLALLLPLLALAARRRKADLTILYHFW